MEMAEEKRGVWLNFPEYTPEDGEQVVVKRNGWYESSMEWDNITDRYLQYLSEREKRRANGIIVIKNNESK
jgi:hypothetical protein